MPTAAETSVVTPPSEPIKAASIVDEYEIEAAPVLPSGSEPKPSEPPPSAEAPSSSPPKDPVTGRFVKREAAEHPAGLVRRAAELGMSDDEITNATTSQLDSMVYHLNQQALAEARTSAQASVLERVRSERDTDSGAPAASHDGAGPGAGQSGAPEPLIHLDEEAFHPDLIAGLKKFAEPLVAKIKSLEAQVAGLAQRDNARTQETVNERIDRAFQQLGDEGNFGTGPVADLSNDDPQYARRIAVLNEARRMAGSKGTVSQQLAKIKAAAERLYGTKPTPKPAGEPYGSPEPAKPSNGSRITAEDWKAGGLARPTNRDTEEPPSAKKAERAVANYMKENGMNDRPGMDSFLD